VKVLWQTPHKTLQLEAESADELNLIGELAHASTLRTATWLRVPETEVCFPHAAHDGITTLIHGAKKVIGLLVDVDPESPRNSHLQALQATGQAVNQLLSLLTRQAQADFPLTTTGVSPVDGDLQKQPPP
jgi:hypothetical protein